MNDQIALRLHAVHTHLLVEVRLERRMAHMHHVRLQLGGRARVRPTCRSMNAWWLGSRSEGNHGCTTGEEGDALGGMGSRSVGRLATSAAAIAPGCTAIWSYRSGASAAPKHASDRYEFVRIDSGFVPLASTPSFEAPAEEEEEDAPPAAPPPAPALRATCCYCRPICCRRPPRPRFSSGWA